MSRDAVLELLTSLADKSLVLAEERDGATRYRLLETVRQYARERLIEGGGEAHWRDRHLAYFLALTKETEPLLKGAVQMGLDQLDTEHDNLRMALDWAESGRGDSAAGLQIAAAIWWFWEQRGHLREGRRRLSRLLDEVPDTQALAIRAKALRGAGALARAQADYLSRRRSTRRAWRSGASSATRAASLWRWAASGSWRASGGTMTLRGPCRKKVSRSNAKRGDRASVAMVLSNLSEVAYHQGDRVTARTRAEESLAIYRELDNQWGIAQAMEHLAQIALADGDFTQATVSSKGCSLDSARTWQPVRACMVTGSKWARSAHPGRARPGGTHLGKRGATARGDRRAALARATGPPRVAHRLGSRGDEG